MPKYSFAFGSNGGYFFSTQLAWASQGLSKQLSDKLYTDVQASKRFVSLGADGKYFYARHSGNKHQWNWKDNHDHTGGQKWLGKQNGIIQLSFGPGDTYVACTPQGGYFGNIPSSIKNSIKGFHPIMATLGVDGAYVVVNEEGRVKWNLKGRYDQLDQILRNSNLAIEVVVLNPYIEQQYIIVFKNGTCRAVLPTTYLDKITEMMRKQNEHDSQIMAIQTRAMQQNQQITINAMQNMMAMSNISMINSCIW